MGQALFNTSIPVAKTSSALTCLVHDAVSENPETPCIRCGRCVSVCPSFIVPQLMMEAALKDNAERYEKLNGMECIECGSCSYVCPAKRPLTQGFKQMKQKVNAIKRAKAAEEKKKQEEAAAKASKEMAEVK